MKLANNYPIDLPRLLETRLLVQANSGGGKSHMLRRLLEQTAPHVQQLVIDPEGEFPTLREKFDYVIAAPHDADAIASPQTAALLARRLLEAGVSAVLDIYDLKVHERHLFVRRFLDALVNAPRALWHPVLIVLDEAHVFCPQTGSSEAASAVIDVATRGRKRGLCLVAATQRLSKLHKDCAAELLNKLIGRTGLDVDVQRAGDELGMTKRDAMVALRDLEPGDFFGFGPAISRSVEKFRVGEVITTHPKSGERLMQAPPVASERVRKQLAKLADLQKEAEHEAKTLEELQAANADLRRKLIAAEKRAAQTGIPESEVQKRTHDAIAALPKAHTHGAIGMPKQLRKALEEVAIAAKRAIDAESSTNYSENIPARTAPATSAVPAPQRSNGKGEYKVLVAIAQHDEGVDREQITILTGYKRSTRDAYIQRLAAAGYISVGSPIVVTEAGLRELGPNFERLPTGRALQEYWLNSLPAGERSVFGLLINSYPSGCSRDAISDHTLYKRSTRDAYIQRLGVRKLISIRGSEVFADKRLFS